MQVLLFGGTRFFGRRLAAQLLSDGHRVAVATRGQRQDDLGAGVERIRLDRTDPSALAAALRGRAFDLVYDQICYTPREAKAALDALGTRVGRYVFTSSVSVYRPQEAPLGEGAFAPETYPYDLGAQQYAYAEGKRQAEAYFFRHAPFPVAAVRVAMVISGTDDYTGRFDFHVQRVAQGKPIGVDAAEQEISFVSAAHAAGFLRFLGTSAYAGPINCADAGPLSAQALCHEIGETLGRAPRFTPAAPGDPDRSPYVLGGHLRCAVDLAQEIGYPFPPVSGELQEMTLESAARLGLR